MKFLLILILLISTSCREEFVHAKSENNNQDEVGKKSDEDCQRCHSQVRSLGDKDKFDAAGIYPQIDPLFFTDGRKVPVLIESTELASVKKTKRGKDLVEKNCLSCHLAHGADIKDVTEIDDRQENLGMWLNLSLIDNILDVEVKFKSFGSGHRVPGGLASRAYVIVVEVEQEAKLKLWHGPKIAEPLRNKNYEAGLTMARLFVDENGKLTNDLKKAKTLLDDTRLEHKRFLGEHFLYKIDPKKEVKARAKLYYLPAFPTWKQAVEVLEKESSMEPK